jgi:hypothetical protein
LVVFSGSRFRKVVKTQAVVGVASTEREGRVQLDGGRCPAAGEKRLRWRF